MFLKFASGTLGKSRGNKGNGMAENSDESDEDRHQRHRRERMLDQVTLILLRDEIGCVINNLDRLGFGSRDAAADICDGINQYDAEH